MTLKVHPAVSLQINIVSEADFETAISATGFGKFNFFLLLVAITSGWAIILDTTTMSYVVPFAICDLNLSLVKLGVLNAITYVGIITSSIIWGYLSDTLGRKNLLVVGYLLDSFFVLVSALSQSYGMIVCAKYMTGFIINGPAAIITTTVSEFHSAKYRAQVLMVMGMIYASANLLLPFLALPIFATKLELELFKARFKMHSWNYFILASAIPSLISSLAHTYLPESPKFLMTVGRNEEALDVFRKIYSCNTGKPTESYRVKSLVDEINMQASGLITANRTNVQALKEGIEQIKPLFSQPHATRIVLVSVIMFGFMMGCHALRLWLPEIFSAMSKYAEANPNKTVALCRALEDVTHEKNIPCDILHGSTIFVNIMIVSFCGLIGFVCIGLFINVLGKKALMVGQGLIAGSFAFGLYFTESLAATVAFSSIVIMLGRININVMFAVTVDLFPTTLRTTSVALTMVFGMTGAMVGNLIFPILLEIGCFVPFLTIGLVMIGCAFLSIGLPKTDLKPLE